MPFYLVIFHLLISHVINLGFILCRVKEKISGQNSNIWFKILISTVCSLSILPLRSCSQPSFLQQCRPCNKGSSDSVFPFQRSYKSNNFSLTTWQLLKRPSNATPTHTIFGVSLEPCPLRLLIRRESLLSGKEKNVTLMAVEQDLKIMILSQKKKKKGGCGKKEWIASFFFFFFPVLSFGESESWFFSTEGWQNYTELLNFKKGIHY